MDAQRRHRRWLASLTCGKSEREGHPQEAPATRAADGGAARGDSLTVLEGNRDRALAVALGQVGERAVIASAGEDGSVRLWDATRGDSLAARESYRGVVRAVALGQVGKRAVIASGGRDGTARLWDAIEAQNCASPSQRVFGPHGAFLDLIAAGDGGYQLGRASPDAWCYFFAQGRAEDGRIVAAPIEAMMVGRADDP